MPKVSVLMPAYNAEKYIAESIESILNQTFQDFELIIIDDCSSDNTWNIMQEYAKKDDRINIFKNEKNLGIGGNRNRLINLARGKYIVWQDNDDISLPERVEKQYTYMEENIGVGILGGYLQLFNEKENLSVRKYATDDGSLRKTIFRYSPVAQPATMIRRSCFDEVGGYDFANPLIEDIDMSFRIGSKYKFANLPEIIIKYRQNENSVTFTRLKTMELNTLKIRKKYVKNFGYEATIFDKIYNLMQYISIFIIPPRMKIRLFNLIRNSKE